MLHILPTHYPLLAATQEPYQNAHLLTKNIIVFSEKKVRSMGQYAREKEKTERVMRVEQKNKRGDSKVASNDSPEIPDGGGGVSDISGFTSGIDMEVVEDAQVSMCKDSFEHISHCCNTISAHRSQL